MKTNASTAQRGFTRRSFIKGAAALTAAGMLTGCSASTEDLVEADTVATEAGKEEIYTGACRGNCFGGCLLDVHVRDGQIVRTTAHELPDPRYNRICSKGLTYAERMYSADRLQYPMRRVGERGSGEFERISWDEAVDEIAEKWLGYIDQYGSESIIVASMSGNSGLKCGNRGGSLGYTRFANVLGASTMRASADHMVDGLSGVITGLSEFAQGNEPTDFKNAHTIVCWGSNPAVSQPQNMHFICEAKENGTRYVVVDPVFNMNAAKADKFIPINATTDAALALGVLNEVISQGKEDQEFLRNHTEAPFLIKEDGKLLRMSDMGVASTQGAVDPTTGQPKVIDPYVVWDEATNSALPVEEADRPALTGVSEVNGVPVKTTWDNLKEIASEYTLSRTSEITGVSEEDIQELAAIYSQDEPVYTYMHYGLDHYSTGQYNFWAVEVLAWACGQVGKPGAACGRTVMNVVSKFNLAAQVPPNGSKTGRMVNSNRMKEILETGTYDGKPLTIKSLFVATHNMVSVNAEVEYIKDWLSEIEFVVVSELNMNDTARWADILLPAADWFEQDDIYAGAGNCPFVIYSEKATEPLFECKTDLEIFKLILDKMGYGDQFPWEDDESCIRDCLDSDALKALGITYETLKEKKAIRIVSGDTYISFEGGKFLTSSGRAMMYQETPFTTTVDQGEIDLSKERAPHWEPSFEADTNSEVRTKYPFHALSDHLRTRTHTQWWNVEYLKEIETEPVVKINPDDAAEIGIKEGDTVRMYNDRGSVVLKAVLNAGLPHGMVSYPRGFQKTEFIDGHAQSLPMRQFNQAFANYAYNDVAVAIEKM